MKKFAIWMVAAAAVVMTACNGAPTAKMKNVNGEEDSLSYAFGVAQGGNAKQYLSMRLGLDTTLVDQFVKGVIDGAKMGNDSSMMAYQAGMQIGQQIATQWVKGLNYQILGNDSAEYMLLDDILAGFADGALGKGSLTTEEAQALADAKMQALQDKRMEVEYAGNKAACEEFMAQLAGREGVKALDNGVYYEVITEGKGAIPADTSKVAIKYVGTLIDGSEFDRSRGDDPYKSRANQFIPGFTNALTHMPAGSKWKVYIPQDQAYGARQMGKINPFSALIFELELVSVD